MTNDSLIEKLRNAKTPHNMADHGGINIAIEIIRNMGGARSGTAHDAGFSPPASDSWCIEHYPNECKCNEKQGEISVKKPWRSPSCFEVSSPEFNAIWDVIKSWDVNVPEVYTGYCGANGNHVIAVLEAIRPYMATSKLVSVSLEKCVEAYRQLEGDLPTDEDAVKAVLDAAGVKYVD